MDVKQYFIDLVQRQKSGYDDGICSICSANAFVIEAAMEFGLKNNCPVLIEATANQVNQFGGYTGMQPADFTAYVQSLAQKIGFPQEQLILGGDHLGPLTWSNEPEAEAMAKAEVLIEAFVKAGFRKIHLDTSMRLKDDPQDQPLSDETIARRAARLCAVAERAAKPGEEPVYVVGSEVPIPGGATENEDALAVTPPENLDATLAAFRAAFHAQGLDEAFTRVIAVVVQPGVEFADNTIIIYDPAKAKQLTDHARSLPFVLEGHSTDYQPTSALHMMRKDGIAILKVGPALTFALREALFALESMEKDLYAYSPAGGYSRFSDVLEQKLMQEPKYWERYYHGTEGDLAFARRYSLSDRSRYYLEDQIVKQAMRRLIENVNAKPLPFGLTSQYFPAQKEAILEKNGSVNAEWLIKERIRDVIKTYY
ncbi:MAG: tagatose-bisphosphate aldolase [Firmicutes bacterium HGW-Firmicutes-9]|jgi:D-tagatose-1,6-bisphosphate aldolase subunit GatZ/KbaZ|nr:MAG: tagatose-bisphosphate aldolase [Firmicutes bacterium HGW-Firmicutes-9]